MKNFEVLSDKELLEIEGGCDCTCSCAICHAMDFLAGVWDGLTGN